ncbi:prolyl oligopeptidase family serine peptidase [Alteromonas sp. 1_MG-2023]|uniref:alpha/beta hydrolase family protein n=1 Tax=Alteromonas sp. 1_MG-2023 TaxID=3062669 RepID=UPI0026E25522|nr:prolyl oligopeptidase family serine peptidase [Alteromonas sp. 1_MG-2023]MDO6566951.1 prolyl oligopeptidase family serine peptidase [Alteromonas sp. 1_MG-2023]
MKRILVAMLAVYSLFISANEELPLEYFIKHGDYLDLQLSPDGQHLAARVRADNKVILAILSTSDMKVVGGVRPNNNDFIHTVTWVTNERLVFEYAEKYSSFDMPVPTGELYAINYDGSGRKMLYGYRASDARSDSRISNKEDDRASQQVISLLESDDKYILISEYPWDKKGNTYYDNRIKPAIISKLNVMTGKKRKIGILPYQRSSALATKNGQVIFMKWQDEEGDYHAAYRDDNESEWKNLEDVFNVDRNLIPRGLSEDEKFVYMSGFTGEEGIYTYFKLDLSTGQYVEIFEPHDTDIEQIVRDNNGLPAVGITYPGKSEYVYAKEETRTSKLHKMLASAFEGQTVTIASHTRDWKTLLVHVRSDVNPGEYYLFDSESLAARFIWANSSWIDPRLLATMKPVSVEVADGESINGYLTLPKQQSDAKPPLVVMIHGGPHQTGTRDFWDYNNETQLLASRGYAVLQMNFRGSDGYGERYKKLGYREWGGKMIDDINDSVKWAIEQNYVDGDNVCAYGASYGGYAALMSAVKEPDLYKCTIGYVGIYDLQYMFTESDIPNNWGGEAYLERVLGNDKAQLKAYSPIYHADKIKAKVMLIHGSEDRRVPEINSEALSKALIKLGNPPVYLQYSQAGHGVFDEEDRRELYQGLIEFLDENLKH